MLRRLLLLVLVASVAALLVPAGRASAHNSLESTDPADGAVLDVAPGEITWVFANAVPLDTLTVTLIDAAGARSELSGSTHGPAGTTEVVTPLPSLTGSVTLRWRLVGPDGHPVTGRVGFTVSAPAPTTTAAAAPTSAVPSATPSVPETTAPPPFNGNPESATAPQESSGADATWTTPSTIRWFLRAASYVGLVVAAGVLLTQRLVYGTSRLDLRRLLQVSLVGVAVLALLQLLVVASDIGGDAPWTAWGAIDASLSTHVGVALLVRLAVATCAYLLIVHAPPTTKHVYDNVLVVLALVSLGTWAFAGHSRSMRWPAIGVPTDVLHYGAAAAWLGGLAIVAFVALPRLGTDDVASVMRRFSTMAATAVGVLVVTGLIQGVRLVGGVGNLFSADHGKLLAVKLAVLGAMLGLAHLNRRRIEVGLGNAGAATHIDAGLLRRTMLLEFAIGLVIIGVTAAMVVSPPAVAG
jgi:copper transport protein